MKSVFALLSVITLACFLITPPPSVANKILSLNAESDYVLIPDSPELRGGPNVVKTIEVTSFYHESARPRLRPRYPNREAEKCRRF